jgi:GTPase Era involved in 16S rRNA processing
MTTQKKDFIVGFIGLPSAGKSTIVNSLAGARILKTGVCRTTTEVHAIGKADIFGFGKDRFHECPIVSDDGVEFTILDLPGMADSENKGTESSFDEMTKAWILNCDIIFWVSNIETAFLTTHELKEFETIREILEKNTIETGSYFRLGVILSKYNHSDAADEFKSCESEVDESTQSTSPLYSSLEESSLTEISGQEDTTLSDCFKRVEETFKDKPDVQIIKFNAFGRIIYKGSTQALTNLVVKAGGASDSNIEFNLKQLVHNFSEKSTEALLSSLVVYHLSKPKTDIRSIQIKKIVSKITDLWAILSLTNFILSTSQDEANSYLPSHIKTAVPYNAIKWNNFARDVGRISEDTEIPLFSDTFFQKIVSNPDLYLRLATLFSPEALQISRIYFMRIAKKESSRTICGYEIKKPELIVSCDQYPDIYPSLAKLDKEFCDDKTARCKKSWIAKVAEGRRTLWGDAEDDISIEMVMHCFSNGYITSLFEQI